MRRPPIVKAGRAKHAKAYIATYRLDATHQVMCLFDFLDRHEVGNFRHPIRGEKAAQEDIRIRQIELFLTGLHKLWGNLKPPTFLMVKERSKDSGRIEVGKGKKVD